MWHNFKQFILWHIGERGLSWIEQKSFEVWRQAQAFKWRKNSLPAFQALPQKKTNAINRACVIRYLRAGESPHEIARKLGISLVGIIEIANKFRQERR